MGDGHDCTLLYAVGTLPASWARLSQMEYLLVQGNSLQGQLPVEWGAGAMPGAYYFNLSSNQV